MLGCALLALIGFRLLNSIFAVALYGIGALLIFPVMFVLWALTAFSMVPGVPTIVTFVKSRLDVSCLARSETSRSIWRRSHRRRERGASSKKL